ncbi:SLT domain-containing protein [Clostridium pasteurianum DSM 525 = ATCC 6013]|uniref:Lytic transglycosylase catalytic n=1 Tax=Clostridium pasteurianum DSM 525 = ATCC 6013 TaxID=1262449 RepID=A0A0H3JB06_CLOPA|nr:SLT domain-containing protein [Clostridium pasteurianum DSM 525 = ATCC 6013]AJA54041.1 SLT domain-containing protein [Clostridium pasteurianum DSM 525 = ATCC 6013]KRU13934.1 Lytic transglycosylase catalytic [Clostridium pasteurianum DSM 525 = ATCC 6013]OMH22119.1 hypothetical protein AC231_12385 [Clostridium pasteurianum]
MADNNSVGKISLDLEVTSDLGKQIEQVASKIGNQLESALKNIGSVDIGKSITNSIESSMKAMQKIIEKNISEAIEKGLANQKKIKVPVEFDMPKNFSMPKQNFKVSTAQPRAPPMPKINTGVNMEALKAQIANLGKSLDITNAKIEQQQAKLASLKESYNMAFDGARKNKLLEQILKTETSINKLIGQSDKMGFKLADLDKQFDILGSAAKNAGSGMSEAATKMIGMSSAASKADKHMHNMSNSTKDMHSNMNNAYGGISMFISSMFTWGLIFPMVIGGITSLGKFIGSTLMVNAQFANSLNQIKSNLYTAFMPIYEAILPALNSLMSALATATAYLASFISQLFGTTYEASFQSAKAMQNQIGAMNIADKQAQKAANSLGGVGKSAKKSADQTKKAAKEVTGALAGFDEINKLSLGNNKTDTPDTPKETTPPGSGVITPITPMANMAPIEATTSKWADKFKDILANIWKPFQNAWAREGQNTINAAKHALNGILALLGAIGKSFYTVWTNGTGETTLVYMLKILQDILNIVGDIGHTFANAWNNGSIGTQVIQSLANALNNVLSLIDKMLLSVRRVWGEEGPKFANIFMQALLAGSKVIENVTQQLGWIWDHGGQHAFEGLVKLGLKIGELALFIFTNFVAPFVNWFVNMVAPAISPVLDAVGKLFDVLSSVIDWLMSDGKPVLDVIIIALGSFALAWNGVTIALKTFWGVFNTVKNFGTILSGAFSILLSPIGLVVLGIAAVIAIGILLYKNWDTVSAFLVKCWNAIKDTAAYVWNGIKDFFSKLWDDLKDFFATWGPVLLVIIAPFIGIPLIIKKHWEEIKGFFSDIWSNLKATVNDGVANIKDKIGEMKQDIQEKWSSIKQNTQSTWDNIKQTTSSKWSDMKKGAQTTWNSIGQNIQNSWNNIRQNTSNSLNNLKQNASNTWGVMRSNISSAWDGFKNIISNSSSNTVNNAKNTWNGLINWFRNLPSTFRNLGRDMINALGDGIRNTINSVVDIAKDLGNKILNKIKDIFGIHSPSREMFKVGNYFVQGFTNALKGNDIGSMVKSVFGDVTSLAKGSLGGPLGVMLKPMIDSGAFGKIGGFLKGMTDKGASFLSSMFGGSGGASGNIKSWLSTALALTGQSMSALPALEQIAMHESGGNPKAINLWDSNAAAGHPSKGLMQTIDSTFNAYKLPGMDDIWNPIHNAVASIRYSIARYGSILNVPGIKSMTNGGGYVGYAKGTNSAKKGLAMTGEVGPEMIDFSGGEMVLNLKDTISLISSAVNTIGNIKNAIAGISTIQQPQLSMTGTSSSDTSNEINSLIDEIKELIEAIKKIKGDSPGGNNQPIPDINLDLLIRIGDTPLGKAAIKAINKLQKQAGKTLIEI